MTEVLPAQRLDEKGRCCGRKPIVYKRQSKLFCPKCDRAFNLGTGEQQQNWAWIAAEGGFIRKYRYRS